MSTFLVSIYIDTVFFTPTKFQKEIFQSLPRLNLHPTDRYPAEYLHCDTCTAVSANFKLFSLTIASLFHAAGEPYLYM